MVKYRNIWYFWHHEYYDYDIRMVKMAEFIKNEVHEYLVNSLTLIPKE